MMQLFAFDGDGCAYDSREHAIRATMSAATSLGELTTLEAIKSSFAAGLPLEQVFKLAAPSSDPKEMVGRFYEFDARQGYETIRPYPNVAKTLSTIRTHAKERILVTNRNRESTLAILASTGLVGYIDDIVTSDDIEMHKPDPEGLFLAMSRTSVGSLQTIYMGDTPGDIETGKNAGVEATIGFTEGFGSVELLNNAGADYLLSNWAFLPRTLRIIEEN